MMFENSIVLDAGVEKSSVSVVICGSALCATSSYAMEAGSEEPSEDMLSSRSAGLNIKCGS